MQLGRVRLLRARPSRHARAAIVACDWAPCLRWLLTNIVGDEHRVNGHQGVLTRMEARGSMLASCVPGPAEPPSTVPPAAAH
jgi:hypothetical protein